MKTSRRNVLASLAALGAAAPLAGCERIWSQTSQLLGQTIPNAIWTPDSVAVDASFHLLSRAAFGPWPGDVDRVRQIGREAWIDEQLSPDTIDDTACDVRARRFETIHHEPGTCYEYKKPVLRAELARHTLLRAVYSRRQLFEVMVHFWSDHLNIYQEKGDCIYLKPSDDRDVVRAHALGNFRDLIRASATSPAMLVYLDGKENRRARPEDVPNENYARELLELHTLGVDGGYTQHDVSEVARCLTGWVLRTTWRKGTVYFDPNLHDDGEKTVLGTAIPPGGGASDLERVVDIVCDHPSTARFVAGKLVRRFVQDPQPQALVERTASAFRDSRGDIKSVVRLILTSPEFDEARGVRIKRPFDFLVSFLRLLGADTHAQQPVLEMLARLGQSPFQYPTPDGYTDEPQPWLGTLLWRWNIAFTVMSAKAPGIEIDVDRLCSAIGAGSRDAIDTGRVFSHFVGRLPSAAEIRVLDRYASDRSGSRTLPHELIALVVSSPAFQRH